MAQAPSPSSAAGVSDEMKLLTHDRACSGIEPRLRVDNFAVVIPRSGRCLKKTKHGKHFLLLLLLYLREHGLIRK